MDFYVCRKMRVLTHLQEEGFQFIKTQRDRSSSDPSRLVWIFKDSPELRASVERFYNSDSFIKKL